MHWNRKPILWEGRQVFIVFSGAVIIALGCVSEMFRHEEKRNGDENGEKKMNKNSNRRHHSNTTLLGRKIGETKAGRAIAAFQTRLRVGRLEAVASDLDANLCDPEHFRICQELAG